MPQKEIHNMEQYEVDGLTIKMLYNNIKRIPSSGSAKKAINAEDNRSCHAGPPYLRSGNPF